MHNTTLDTHTHTHCTRTTHTAHNTQQTIHNMHTTHTTHTTHTQHTHTHNTQPTHNTYKTQTTHTYTHPTHTQHTHTTHTYTKHTHTHTHTRAHNTINTHTHNTLVQSSLWTNSDHMMFSLPLQRSRTLRGLWLSLLPSSERKKDGCGSSSQLARLNVSQTAGTSTWHPKSISRKAERSSLVPAFCNPLAPPAKS